VVLSMEEVSSAGKAIRDRADGVTWTTNTLATLVRQLEDSISPLRRCTAGGQAANAAAAAPRERAADVRKRPAPAGGEPTSEAEEADDELVLGGRATAAV
jgi:hypothetical protein